MNINDNSSRYFISWIFHFLKEIILNFLEAFLTHLFILIAFFPYGIVQHLNSELH